MKVWRVRMWGLEPSAGRRMALMGPGVGIGRGMMCWWFCARFESNRVNCLTKAKSARR